MQLLRLRWARLPRKDLTFYDDHIALHLRYRFAIG
ncbi:hypothetical protein FRC0484_01394 [Corynebacterium diphtheriae]|nr:hypothetical protein B11Q_01298 [Corynebacterium diphtheriae]CAB0505629.1 hypothetical protein CIP100294_01056 [Corynebacterium diphtheriae]CAB0506153.1 hypothetical protein CIP101280_01060 [Corynebacterium diphtheriae]CAB0507217.1 hypothetical protein CIP102550_01102 [Corynebacterium diphtheriae]CAB0509305.1 hypothetical protein CIP100275_01216 [Corynebacterium diphtheriae]